MKKTIFLFVIFFIAGCGSTTQISDSTTDSGKNTIEYRDRIIRDSIIWKDTVVIRSVNDTIYSNVVRWRTRTLYDTLFVEKKDSIYVYKDVERLVTKEVNKLNFWQKIRLRIFNVMILAIILLGGWIFFKRNR